MDRQRAYSGRIRVLQPLVDFRILGPLEVVDAGSALPLGGRNQRTLLALLLLHAGEVVSTDRLIDALWGEEPPRTAQTSLQNSISHLRKLLGAERLVTQVAGLRATASATIELDARRARELVREARAARAAERVGAAARGRALWRGPPLADLAYEPFAQPAIAQLEELRLAVVEDRIDAELELGRHAELVASSRRSSPSTRSASASAASSCSRSTAPGARPTRCTSTRTRAARSSTSWASTRGRRSSGSTASILRQERALDRAVRRATAEDDAGRGRRALLAGRLVPVLGAEIGELAHAARASGSTTPPDEAARADPRRPVRRAHAGRPGRSTTSCTSSSSARARADADPPLPRLARRRCCASGARRTS